MQVDYCGNEVLLLLPPQSHQNFQHRKDVSTTPQILFYALIHAEVILEYTVNMFRDIILLSDSTTRVMHPAQIG